MPHCLICIRILNPHPDASFSSGSSRCHAGLRRRGRAQPQSGRQRAQPGRLLPRSRRALLSLDAFFIGVIQVLVYAGAVMVLFLFIIMLLDLKAEKRRKIERRRRRRRSAVAARLSSPSSASSSGSLPPAKQPFPPLARRTIDDVRNVGLPLFSTHNLPFQVIGVLILVATIGVVVLSKRELRNARSRSTTTSSSAACSSPSASPA